MIELQLLAAMGAIGRRYDRFIGRPHTRRLWLIAAGTTLALACVGLRRGDAA